MKLRRNQLLKVGDYFVDISKYSLTTTVIGTFFGGSIISWNMFFGAIIFSLCFLAAGLFLIGLADDETPVKGTIKTNNPKQKNKVK